MEDVYIYYNFAYLESNFWKFILYSFPNIAAARQAMVAGQEW